MADGITLEKLNIVIKGSAESAERSVNQLISSLTQLKIAAGNMTSEVMSANQAIKNISTAAGQSAREVSGASKSAMRDISGTSQVERELTQGNSNVERTSKSAANEVSNMAKSFREAKSAIKDYYSLLNRNLRSNTDIKNNAGVFESESGAWNTLAASLNDAKMRYDSVTESIANLNQEKREELTLLDARQQEQYNLAVERSANAHNSAASAVAKHASAAKKLLSSIGRIGMYRLIRSAIKEITQAVMEGTQEFIEWDRNYNGGMAGAANATDELKAQWGELKGAIGAAAGAIITLVKPVIEWIVDRVIDLVNLVQQVARGLQGEETWYRRIRKEATATTGQAKELRRVLFGFDELNVLNGNSGGGTSSASGPFDYIEEEVPQWTKDIYGFFDNIKHKGKDTSEDLEKDFQDAAEGAGEKAKSKAKETGNAIRTVFGEVLGGAELEVKKLNNYVHKNPITIPVTANVPAAAVKRDYSELRDWIINRQPNVTIGFMPDLNSAVISGAAGGAAAKLGTPVVPLKFGVSNEGLQSAIEAAEYVSKSATFAAPAIEFKTILDSSGATEALNKWFSEAQQFLSKNFLKVFVKQVSSDTSSSSSLIPTFTPSPISIPTKAPIPVAGSGGGGKVIDTSWETSALPTPAKASLPAVGSGGGGKVAVFGMDAEEQSTKELINDLTNQLLKNPAANPLGTAEGRAMEKLLASFAAGGLAASLIAELGAALSSLPAGLSAILGFANGGTPDMGTLFYAGERGPEVVTRMANNQSGVMNIMQMQTAMEGANKGVESAVYAMSTAIVNAIRNKALDVYMDSEIVSRKVSKAQGNTARRFGEGAMA